MDASSTQMPGYFSITHTSRHLKASLTTSVSTLFEYFTPQGPWKNKLSEPCRSHRPPIQPHLGFTTNHPIQIWSSWAIIKESPISLFLTSKKDVSKLVPDGTHLNTNQCQCLFNNIQAWSSVSENSYSSFPSTTRIEMPRGTLSTGFGLLKRGELTCRHIILYNYPVKPKQSPASLSYWLNIAEMHKQVMHWYVFAKDSLQYI